MECTEIILSDQQQDIVRWYWIEHHPIAQIAEWLERSPRTIERELYALRAIFRSHGIELPCFDRKRRRVAIEPEYVGVI